MKTVWAVLAFPFRAVMFLIELIAAAADWLAERKKKRDTLPLTPQQNAFFEKLQDLRKEKATAIADPAEKAEWNERSKKIIEDAKRKVQVKSPRK